MSPEPQKSQKGGIVLSAVLGFIAAIATAVIWYLLVVLTKWQFGLLAMLVGFVVGQAVLYGSGRKGSLKLQIISAVLTLFGMALGEYLITRHFASLYFISQGYSALPLFLHPYSMLSLIIAGLKSDPLTLLFWAIALWYAFAVPAFKAEQVIPAEKEEPKEEAAAKSESSEEKTSAKSSEKTPAVESEKPKKKAGRPKKK